MHEVRTEIEATPERVGSILLDFPSHPEWNPFVRCIEGFAITVHVPGRASGGAQACRPVEALAP